MVDPCTNKGLLKIRRRYTLRSLSVGFAFFILLSVVTKIFNISVCPIKNIFGISCFGCGMTRAFKEIIKFNFVVATFINN